MFAPYCFSNSDIFSPREYRNIKFRDVHEISWDLIRIPADLYIVLTHCGIVMPHGELDIG